MAFNLASLFVKKNHAPEWFVEARKSRMPEEEIKNRIRAEIMTQANIQRYDPKVWTDEFIGKVTDLYYRFFEQLYSTR